jgi:hypothetical protein
MRAAAKSVLTDWLARLAVCRSVNPGLVVDFAALSQLHTSWVPIVPMFAASLPEPSDGLLASLSTSSQIVHAARD